MSYNKFSFIKKIFIFILAFILISGVFAGCSANQTSDKTANVSSNRLLNFKGNVFDIEVGDSQNVRFTVESGFDQNVASINLCTENTVLGEMTDDGKNGDYIANDGIYTCTVDLLQENRCGVDYYAAYNNEKSNEFTISFYDQITEDEYEGFLELSNSVDDCSDYNSAYKIISSSNDVVSFDADESAQTISYETNFGITGLWETRLSDDYKGTRLMPSEVSVPEDSDYSDTIEEIDEMNIGSLSSKKSTLVIRPFRNDGFEYDDFLYAGAALSKAANGTLNVCDNSEADLDTFKSFDDYGTVLVDSHGSKNFKKTYILTGERFGFDNMLPYIPDLVCGRISICAGTYSVTSKFFDKYYSTNSLDDTTIFLGSCYSAYNDSFGTSLTQKGSPLVLGYSDAVYVSYCNKTLKSFMIDNLLLKGEEASVAFSNTVSECGKSDGNAEFVMYKSGKEVRLYNLGEQTSDEKGLSFSIPESMDIVLGEAGVIEPEISSTNDTDYTLNWTSSNPDVVNVNSQGTVGVLNTLSSGSSTITATLVTSNEVVTDETIVSVAPVARDVVLVLDCSSSMYGEPFDEMKEVAEQFCDDIIGDNSKNRVAVVSYETEVSVTDLTSDINSIKSYIENLYSTGTTNTEGALSEAGNILSQQGNPDAVKNIIIMTDGIPNVGKTSNSNSFVTSSGYTGDVYANAVVDTANDLMGSYNIYSLGFFHSLYGSTLQYAKDLVSQLTNQNNGYYEVTDSENLQFAFGDIGETINDGSKIIVNIACPVDVRISYNGESLSSAAEDYCDATSFGTLSVLGKNKDVKVMSLDSENVYDINLTGTGNGSMDMAVNYYNQDNELYDSREFAKVPLNDTTKMDSTTDNSNVISLNIDSDGDGIYDDVWEAAENAMGSSSTQKVPTVSVTRSSQNTMEVWQICIIAVCAAVAFGTIVIAVSVVVKRKSKEKIKDQANNKALENSLLHNDQGNHNYDTDRLYDNKFDNIPKVPSHSFSMNSGMNGEIINYEIVPGQTINIGKEASWANIVISQSYNKVSRKHCTVSFDPIRSQFIVCDLSMNGLEYPDGSKLQKGSNYVSAGETLYFPDKTLYIKFLK